MRGRSGTMDRPACTLGGHHRSDIRQLAVLSVRSRWAAAGGAYRRQTNSGSGWPPSVLIPMAHVLARTLSEQKMLAGSREHRSFDLARVSAGILNCFGRYS